MTRVPAQPRTEIRAAPDPIIEKAIAATQRAKVSMIRKYTKKHDIQHWSYSLYKGSSKG